jgi:transcriptional regulator with XRE-family HTH domain
MEPAIPGPRNGADPVPHRFNGHALKAYRSARGLSRAALSQRAQLSRPTLKAMERNLIRPSDGAFKRICDALGVSVDTGRAGFCGPGPADHRPMEFSAEAGAAERSETMTGRRRRALRLMSTRRAEREGT